MKRRKVVIISLAMLCLVMTIICAATVLSLRAEGPCYYCGWNNQYQMYECKLYMGPGYHGCFAQGTFCQGTGSCGIPPQ